MTKKYLFSWTARLFQINSFQFVLCIVYLKQFESNKQLVWISPENISVNLSNLFSSSEHMNYEDLEVECETENFKEKEKTKAKNSEKKKAEKE